MSRKVDMLTEPSLYHGQRLLVPRERRQRTHGSALRPRVCATAAVARPERRTGALSLFCEPSFQKTRFLQNNLGEFTHTHTRIPQLTFMHELVLPQPSRLM